MEAGIPIVAVNTRVNNDKITSYIGSKDVTAGEMIMQKIADQLGEMCIRDSQKEQRPDARRQCADIRPSVL